MAQVYAPESVLEIGPYKLPLYHDSAILDAHHHIAEAIIHDARESPWPFADQLFDLGMALQVFEHFTGQQRLVFSEMFRVCKSVLVSIPYKWEQSPSDDHAGLTLETLADWTGRDFNEVQIVGPIGRQRALAFYL